MENHDPPAQAADPRLWHRAMLSKVRMVLLGTLLIAASLLSYPAALPVLDTEPLRLLESLAYLALALTLTGLFGVGYGLRQILRVEASRVRMLKRLPSSTFSMLACLLSERHRIFNVTAVMYGLFYAVVSGTIVYRPWEKFSEAYLAQIPSILVTVCCGPTGHVPRFVVYLTEHLGLLIIPLNLILLFAFSWLVGLNASLVFFAYEHRRRRAGVWPGGFGAMLGLFTGCPTCALLFATILGGVGAVSVAAALAPLQGPFIAISILLLVTPFLTSRKLLSSCSSSTRQCGANS